MLRAAILNIYKNKFANVVIKALNLVISDDLLFCKKIWHQTSR